MNPIADSTRIAGVYFMSGLLYVLFSNQILRAFSAHPTLLTSVRMYEGMAFILLSSLLIFFLVLRSQKTQSRLLSELDAKVKVRTEELENAKNLAESANKIKSEFIANMSHELRTPLNAIIGFSDAMLNGVYGPVDEAHAKPITDILTSGERLLQMINDILDISKIESGSVEVEFRQFSLDELVKLSVGMFREKTLKHGIRLEYALDAVPDAIVGDQRKLKQILVNLIANSIKFTPDNGSVVVKARTHMRPGREASDPVNPINSEKQSVATSGEEGDYLEISVEDTGIGIAGEDVQSLFQPFKQMETPYSKRFGGTGLGLFLAKRLAELQGGSISVKAGDGKGACFTVRIPLRGMA